MEHDEPELIPDEGTDETASPRMRWFLVLLQRIAQGAVVFLALVFVAAFAWLQSSDFQVRAVGLAEGLLEEALGEQVTITAINARYWPPGLTAHGVHVFHEPTGDTIVSAERVRIPIRLRLSGGPEIGRIHLQSPVVHVHLDQGSGLREFKNRLRPPEELRRPLKRLPFRALEILDGRLRLDFPDGHVEIDDLQVDPSRHGHQIGGNLEIVARDLVQRTHFEWPNTLLGPETIVIPHLALDLEALSLAGRAAITLDGPIDVDATAKVQLEHLAPLLGEPRMLYGLVDLDARIDGRPNAPHAKVAAAVSDFRADLPGALVPLLTYEFGDLSLAADLTPEGARIEEAVLYLGGGWVRAWGTVTPELHVVDGHAVGEGVHLEPLLRAFDAAPTPWVDFTADAEVAFEGPLTPKPDLSGTFDLAVVDLHVADRPYRDPAAQLRLDIPHAHASGSIRFDEANKVISLEADRVVAPRNRGTASIDIGLLPRGPLDLRFDLANADLEDFRPLSDVGLKGKGAVTGRIWGPFNALQMEGQGDLEGFEVLGVPYAERLTARIRSPDMQSIHLEEARAEVGRTRYGGDFSFDFRPPLGMTTDITIERGRIEDVTGMFVDLGDLTGDVRGTLKLDGPLYELDGVADLALLDVNVYGERFETGRGRGFMDGGRFTLDDLRVRRAGGAEGITLRGSVDRAWALDMELSADGLRLERLDLLTDYALPMQGALAVSARITNTLFDPSPAGRIWVTGMQYAGRPVANSQVKVVTTDGVAQIDARLLGSTARVRGTLGLWEDQPYDLTAQLDGVPAHTLYPEAADGSDLTALVSGTVTVAGAFGETPTPVRVAATLPSIEARFHHHVLRNRTPWRYTQSGDTFALRNFNLFGPTTRLSFEMESDDGGLVLAGEGVADLDLARALVPGLTRASGEADIRVEAIGARPNVDALVHVGIRADLLRHASAPLTFEDAVARIDVRRDRIDLLQLSAELGGGTVTGRGRIDAQDWQPKRYNLQMQVSDAQVQWVSSLPPAIGNGRFAFDGPVGSLLLSGDIDVTEMTFADRIDWEDWVVSYRDTMLVDPGTVYEDDPLFNLNVRIGAERTIRLRNNVAEGIASADLRVIGDTNRPGLVGTVTVNDGLAFLQDREFRIDRGNVLYNDPWTWDPQLDFALVTDIDSRDQRYRVNYQVFGPFSDWRTSTRSEPPLPQSDVNALLWFGVTLEELEERGDLSSAVVQGVADLLVADFFISGQAADFRNELPDFLQFDRIDLATGVNVRGDYSPEPRLVVDKRLHDLADIDLTWELNLLRPDETFLSAEKRIGGRWSLSGWYATLQRNRVLPIGGAYGVDVSARWEIE